MKLKTIRSYLNQDRMFKYSKILNPIELLIFKLITIGALQKLKKSYILFTETGKTPENVIDLIIKSNFASKGNINLTSESKLQYLQESRMFSSIEIKNAIEALRIYGYAQIGIIENKTILDSLNCLENLKVYRANDRKKVLYEKPDPNLYHRWQIPPELVLENLGVQSLLLDNFWKIIAQQYLSNFAKIAAIRCWHSFAHKDPEILSPENWHLDNGDGLNFIKFFVLLSEVDKDSGPTSIIPLSSSQLPRKFFTGRRFSDQEVNKLLTKKNTNIVNAIGPVGMVYVADTRLLHRGTPVKKGSRLILNWTASTDSFGGLENEKYKIKSTNPLYQMEFINCKL